jgi:hypothetical protein
MGILYKLYKFFDSAPCTASANSANTEIEPHVHEGSKNLTLHEVFDRKFARLRSFLRRSEIWRRDRDRTLV